MSRINNICSRCGSFALEYKRRGPHVGVYCNSCGAWHGWIKQDSLREMGIDVAAIPQWQEKKEVELVENTH